jgi:hypothetical protein
MTVNAMQGVIGPPVVATEDDAPAGAITGPEAFLPDPVAARGGEGDPGAELAALAVKSGQQQQTNAQAARDVEQKIEVGEDNQQVAAMRQKAQDTMAGGIAEGLGMMSEGAFDAASAGAMSSSGQETTDSRLYKADGMITHAEGKIGSALYEGAAGNDDANAAAARSASDQAKSAADDAHDAKKSGGDLVAAALDFYKEYSSAQAATRNAALHRA